MQKGGFSESWTPEMDLESINMNIKTLDNEIKNISEDIISLVITVGTKFIL